MQALFSPDSKIMQTISRIGDLMILNVVFLLTCLPVVTIGAANTALYTVCFRFGTEREGKLLRSYFRAFRDNFRQGTVLWLILLLFGAASCVNILLFYALNSALRYAALVFAVALVLVVLIFSYTFPLLSQFNNNNLSTLKNALVLSIAYLPRSVVIAALNLLPWVLFLLNLYVFLQAGFFWIFFYFATAAYLNTYLLKKVFAPYLNQEKET